MKKIILVGMHRPGSTRADDEMQSGIAKIAKPNSRNEGNVTFL